MNTKTATPSLKALEIDALNQCAGHGAVYEIELNPKGLSRFNGLVNRGLVALDNGRFKATGNGEALIVMLRCNGLNRGW